MFKNIGECRKEWQQQEAEWAAGSQDLNSPDDGESYMPDEGAGDSSATTPEPSPETSRAIKDSSTVPAETPAVARADSLLSAGLSFVSNCTSLCDQLAALGLDEKSITPEQQQELASLLEGIEEFGMNGPKESNPKI